MKCLRFFVLALIVCLPAAAQQTDVSRYSLYTGFDSMISPARSLTEYGFDVDFGVTVRPWLAIGGDFGALGNSIIHGSGVINGSETVYAPTLNAASAANPTEIPSASAVNVPFNSTTITFAAGPQFYLRKLSRVTFFARPGFGGIHESADLTFPAGLPQLLGALSLPVPTAHQGDTTWFIGVGGGCDFNFSRRVGMRVSVDYINTHLFSNLLTDRQNYTRFTIGPIFHWGEFK